MNNFQQRFIEAVKLREQSDLRAAMAEAECEQLRCLIAEAQITMQHAVTFIASREKMHPDGQKLFCDLIPKMKAACKP